MVRNTRRHYLAYGLILLAVCLSAVLGAVTAHAAVQPDAALVVAPSQIASTGYVGSARAGQSRELANPGTALATFGFRRWGIECQMAKQLVQCQVTQRGTTSSVNVMPSGKVSECVEPSTPAPCVLWPGAKYPTLEPTVSAGERPGPASGPFVCVPVTTQRLVPDGAVCTVAKTGKGFRIAKGRITRVELISGVQPPPCTKAAFKAALHSLRRGVHVHFDSWRCAGEWASGNVTITIAGRGDGGVELLRASGRRWRTVSREPYCPKGVIPAELSWICWVD
jgi:hypothetical protein